MREPRKLGSEGLVVSRSALAWVFRQGNDIVPITGTKRVPYLEENVGALDVDLSADDLTLIEEAFPRGVTTGERYPDMSPVNV